MSLDKVELKFEDGALEAAAERALELKTGARGLRTIIEETLLDVMYEIPSRTDVRKCVITADTIRSQKPPLLVTRADRGRRDASLGGRERLGLASSENGWTERRGRRGTERHPWVGLFRSSRRPFAT